MKCETYEKLRAQEAPSDDELRSHAQGCDGCRDFDDALQQARHDLAGLPVPALPSDFAARLAQRAVREKVLSRRVPWWERLLNPSEENRLPLSAAWLGGLCAVWAGTLQLASYGHLAVDGFDGTGLAAYRWLLRHSPGVFDRLVPLQIALMLALAIVMVRETRLVPMLRTLQLGGRVAPGRVVVPALATLLWLIFGALLATWGVRFGQHGLEVWPSWVDPALATIPASLLLVLGWVLTMAAMRVLMIRSVSGLVAQGAVFYGGLGVLYGLYWLWSTDALDSSAWVATSICLNRLFSPAELVFAWSVLGAGAGLLVAAVLRRSCVLVLLALLCLWPLGRDVLVLHTPMAPLRAIGSQRLTLAVLGRSLQQTPLHEALYDTRRLPILVKDASPLVRLQASVACTSLDRLGSDETQWLLDSQQFLEHCDGLQPLKMDFAFANYGSRVVPRTVTGRLLVNGQPVRGARIGLTAAWSEEPHLEARALDDIVQGRHDLLETMTNPVPVRHNPAWYPLGEMGHPDGNGYFSLPDIWSRQVLVLLLPGPAPIRSVAHLPGILPKGTRKLGTIDVVR
ncbi:MAG: hypothetical protein ACYCW6_14320 [Candidatus Xenobia bacterium]